LERHRSAALTLMFAITTAASVASAQTSATLATAPAGATATAASTATDSTPKTVAPPSSPAADTVPTFFRDITFNAFVSLGYNYNFNQPQDQINGLRIFDDLMNNFNLVVGELVIQKPISKIGEAGFRIDLEVGTSIPPKEQSVGLNIGNGADLQQMYVSYIANVGSGLRLDFGKFITPLGYEVIEGYDGYNDSYSRSLLFNYAIPLTHTGAKASYVINSKASVYALLVNGWDQALDLNASKTFGVGTTITPSSALTIYANYMGGPELEDDNHNIRHVVDASVVYKANDNVLFALNGDYGVEGGTSEVDPGESAKWYGAAAYARLGSVNSGYVGLRAESFNDQGGTRMIPGTQLFDSEFTITPTYNFSNKFVIRAELRVDHANKDVFMDEQGSLKATQATVGVNAMFVF